MTIVDPLTLKKPITNPADGAPTSFFIRQWQNLLELVKTIKDIASSLWARGDDIASSSTITITEGGYFHVTGTTTITDIDFDPDYDGRPVWLVFDGVLTLTHNATTLILPTGANIVTAAGDALRVVSEGSDVARVIAYTRKDGTALAVNYATTTEQLTGTATNRSSTPDSVAALWEQGSNIASAATITIGEGGYFHVTGTTTITDIDWGTDKAGRHSILVFDGALTLTHNATTLILPTGANITTAAGDSAVFVSEGSDVARCVLYMRKDGTALTGGTTFASTTEQLTGTEAAKASTPDSIAALWEKGSDITSAATISIGEGGFFHVTGTTTITDIDFGTDKAGRHAWLVFDGALTLTHNGTTLILPTGANITTAAGDAMLVVSEDGSDNVRVIAMVRKDGTSLASGAIDVQEFTIAGANTWTKPAGAKYVEVILFGAGGSGGGGQGGAAGTGRQGGGGGGGGARVRGIFLASTLGGTETVTVGTGSSGGAGGSSAAGIAGTVGGATSFGSWLNAHGGGAGAAGNGSTNKSGGGGGSGGSVGEDGGTSAAFGGGPTPFGNNADSVGETGAASALGSTGGRCAEAGGGGGGGAQGAGTTPAGGDGGRSLRGGGGGGGGGGVGTGNSQQASGAGGLVPSWVRGISGGVGTPGGGPAGGASGGTNNGTDGAAGTFQYGGTGGGGGGSNGSGTAGRGGHGGARGGGGGGGGGGTTTGGAGGNGGIGYAIVISHM